MGYLFFFQSEFRSWYGMDVALVAALAKQDGNHPSILALLDLSVAFDSIEHSILLGCLGGLWVGGTVLLLNPVGVCSRRRDPVREPNM